MHVTPTAGDGGQLRRRLGLFSAISITVGAVIGSGIFLKPLQVAHSVPAEPWVYVLWVGLGIVCLFGAFAYAELGAMFPEAGGQYAFLREGWGRGVAFLYGWTFFLVINTGTIAALALAFADYLLPLFRIDVSIETGNPAWKIAVAGGLILALALVNHFGVVLGALLQNVATLAKVAAFGVLIVGGVMMVARPEAAQAAPPLAEGVQTSLSLGAMVTAFTAIFWAYEGWYQLPFNAAELKKPQRDLPLGLIVGMLILIALYTVVNALYLHVVPFEEMRSIAKGSDQAVAALTVERVFSKELAGYLTLFVAISIAGSANPNLLSSPRAFYAMAQDGMLPQALTRVSPRWGTPVVAIWIQAIWALAIVLVPWFTPKTWGLRGFHDVTAFVVFAGFLFYAITVAGVYRLRRLRPTAERPSRCFGYPWSPALFILVSVAFVVALLWEESERKNAVIGLCIIGAGLPCYGFWVLGRNSRLEARPPAG